MTPAWVGLLVQAGASLLSLALVWLGWLAVSYWLPVQVGLAVLGARMLGQPRWWLLIHALFAPAIVLGLWLDLPPWIYLLAFTLAWLLFGRIDRSRVPLYLSNQATLAALEPLLPKGASVLDIGAGTGTVLAGLGRRSDLQLTGVEHAWLPWLLGWCRLRLSGRPIAWLRGDMMAVPLRDFDVVYAFLSPAAMPAVWQKARQEMASGSLLISNTFAVPDVTADRIIEVNDWKGARLHLWRMP
ncbi:class I SAM-dependent methyltransferase [Chitinimonas sp. JJ19]|uniref:class I SAM-dependent methyltransferase n=1 Tax=Chitinimonas sp. JJ19 TaxID=3109352 RepID=UPI003002A80F